MTGTPTSSTDSRSERADQYLVLDDLLSLCRDLGELVIRDAGLLASASARPSTDVFGREAYPGLDAKAAVLMESIVRNHALVDGNKRLGWVAVVVFYGLNGVDLDAPDDDVFDTIVALAAGELEWRVVAERLGLWRG